MKTKMLKGFVTMMVLSLFVLPMFAIGGIAKADLEATDLWGGEDQLDDFEDNVNLGSQDPRTIAAAVIQVMLGFLGIISIVIILLGGFKWMTAGGNEDQVGEAKKIIGAGVIGLIIILASYGLANFVIEAIVGATT